MDLRWLREPHLDRHELPKSSSSGVSQPIVGPGTVYMNFIKRLDLSLLVLFATAHTAAHLQLVLAGNADS